MTFLEESQILDEQITIGRGAARTLIARARRPRASPTRPSCCRPSDGVLRIKAVERKTNLARTHRLRRSLFESNEYRQLARVHAELVKMAGTPPFTVELGDEQRRGAVVRGPAPRR